MQFRYLLHNSESKTDPIMIIYCCALQLSKAIEQGWDALGLYSLSRIYDLQVKNLKVNVVIHDDLNRASFGKLYRIFEQIHKDLLESSSIADQLWK